MNRINVRHILNQRAYRTVDATQARIDPGKVDAGQPDTGQAHTDTGQADVDVPRNA